MHLHWLLTIGVIAFLTWAAWTDMQQGDLTDWDAELETLLETAI